MFFGGEEVVNVVNVINLLLKFVYFDNFEVSLECYLSLSGFFLVNGYYKDVKNYVFEIEEMIEVGVDYGYDLSVYIGDMFCCKVNGGKGMIWGVEVLYL